MILQVPNMPIADVSLPQQWPLAELVGQWTWVFCQWVEEDTVYAKNGELHKDLVVVERLVERTYI
jgi:hypothetical protein